jgi:hypothetical protein
MPISIFNKLSPITSKFLSATNNEETEEVLYIVEEQVPQPKLTKYEIFILILTLYAIIVSITLNTNDSLRKYLGFKENAGIVSTVFSIFMVFIFGPILYLIALLTKFFESFGTYLLPNEVNVTKTWVEGLAYVAKNQQGIIANLMTPFTWF